MYKNIKSSLLLSLLIVIFSTLFASMPYAHKITNPPKDLKKEHYYEKRKSFLIIRFQNESTRYKRLLKRSVKAVLKQRPDTIFDIVSLYKETSPQPAEKKTKQNKLSKMLSNVAKIHKEEEQKNDNVNNTLNLSSKRTFKIIKELMKCGVDKDHIRVNYQLSDLDLETEVHIFLR